MPEATTSAPFFSRQERFASVGSTNDVVRAWLADGTAEVCLAVADEQTAGRGRDGRSWVAPAGAALLLSLGFRPGWIDPARAWRLAATVSLAMADAAEEAGGLPDRAIRLKWPNDLVVETAGPDAPLVGEVNEADALARRSAPLEIRKLAGVLGESSGLGGPDPRAVVGIGINADWAATDFPPAIASTMTSLREASGGRPVDLATLLDAFTSRLEPRIEALRTGWFDVGDWIERQVTTGRLARILGSAGRPAAEELVRAVGVDANSGALRVVDADGRGPERSILVGDVVHLRLAEPVAAGPSV